MDGLALGAELHPKGKAAIRTPLGRLNEQLVVRGTWDVEALTVLARIQTRRASATAKRQGTLRVRRTGKGTNRPTQALACVSTRLLGSLSRSRGAPGGDRLSKFTINATTPRSETF